MTHPTEAGERERLLAELNDLKARAAKLIRSGATGNAYGLARRVEDFHESAANLLRTEPGGEAFDWRDLMGEILHGDLYLTGPDIQVLSNDAVEEIFECYRRPTTPVEPCPWQPMETAPKDGTGILVALARDALAEHVAPLAFAAWEDGDWYDLSTGEYGDWFEPTHWMPAPSAPVEEREPNDG